MTKSLSDPCVLAKDDPESSVIGIRSWGRHAGRVGLFLLFGGLFLAPAAVSAGMLLSLVAFPFAVSHRGEFVRQLVVLAALACTKPLVASERSTAPYPGTAP